jgi:SAM-dependent methyltransferase
MSQPTPAYLHGTKPEEQQRLSKLNEFLNAACLRELRLRGGESILDLGSGLGQLTREFARLVGASGRVVGIERSDEQRQAAKRLASEAGEDGLVDFRAGDVLDPPLREAEWGSFDLAHARFVLEHVTDPLAVVQGMVRAVRPGGRIVLEDDDHELLRLWPEPPGLSALWHAYMRMFDRNGNDPYSGRRLVSLLHDAGAKPARNTWIFFGGCSGSVEFPWVVENLAEILEGVREPIVSEDLFDRSMFNQTIDALRAWGARPDAAFWFAVSWAEGVRPASRQSHSSRSKRKERKGAT